MPGSKIKLVKFDTVADVDCYYARKNAAYGDLTLCTKNRVRKINPSFLKKFAACIRELAWISYPWMGELGAMTSGGAYVAKAGWHGKGKAYDLGGLFWQHGKLSLIDLARDYHGDGAKTADYLVYLACEAILRKHFGTVLGIHYNRAHWNHWHIDPGSKVGYWDKGFGSNTRVTFVQAVLDAVWGIPLEVDGNAGRRTKGAIKNVRAQMDLEPLTKPNAWQQFLLLTAMKAWQVRRDYV